MGQDNRWAFLVELDEELLQGGIFLSEWCSFIVKEADTAFVNGAYLASILTAVSAIETYLRAEYSDSGNERLIDLINKSSIKVELKQDIHRLRKYRNKWVHLEKPWNDSELIEKPEKTEKDLEDMAFFSIRTLRRTIYETPWA